MADLPTVDDVKLEGSLYNSDSTRVARPTADPWFKADRLERTRMLRQALAFQRRLEKAAEGLFLLSTSMSMAELQAPHAANLIRLTTDVTTSSFGLNEFFSGIASTSLHNERRSSTGCPARQVFDVPELLEQILGYLDTVEILRVSEVDCAMYNTIESSPRLLEKLHLRPSQTGFLETPFYKEPRIMCASRPRRKIRPPRFRPHVDFPGFQCYAESTRGTPKAAMVAQLSFQLPQIGKRCQKMLICQPPVYEMGVYPLCCTHNPYYCASPETLCKPLIPATSGAWYDPMRPPQSDQDSRDPPFEVVRSEKGITVGDLCDMVITIRKAHDLCPWASADRHDDNGNVTTMVSFGGVVTLKSDDPAVAVLPTPPPPTFPTQDFPDPFRQRGIRPYNLLEQYVEVKRRAYANGEPRPSFPQFKASIDTSTVCLEGTGRTREEFEAWLHSERP